MGARAAGERFAALELNTLIQAAVVTDDTAAAAEQLATRFHTTPELVRDCAYALVGTSEAICETIRERRKRYGISYLSIFELDAEAFAPVVAKLAGT